jgi:glycosyltransferase involved in cell wall biosynthesis
VTVPTLSFVIPCLNEAATIGYVIADCEMGGQALGEPYEIVVADNGSTDGSREIAVASGARVVPVVRRGYGAALIAGIQAADGIYVLMGDADSTYDFRQAPDFIARLREGHDLVMGNRFKGLIAPGAMPFMHRYLGNPVLSTLGRIFFGIKVGDFHCGLRAFDREAIALLNLQCQGMEFASEMVIKSSLMDLSIAEIPTTLRPNPPGRKPHLNTWRDGWRHLKFMLSFAPKYSLLPIASLLAVASVVLAVCFALRQPPFTGPNTLVFAVSLAIAATSVFTDYLLTREMIYSRFSQLKKSKASRSIDWFLGLPRGTDRLFKVSAIGILAALFLSILLIRFAVLGQLGEPIAALTGFLSCIFLLSSVMIYLTATKITAYRSLHSGLPTPN